MAQLLGVAAVAGIVYAALPNPKKPAREWKADTEDEIPAAPPKGSKPYTTKPDEGCPIRYSKSGMASKRFGTVPEVFKMAVENASKFNADHQIALRQEKPGYPADRAGEWREITWAEYYEASKKFAAALLAVGHKPYEAVCISAYNTPEWHFAHMGTILACGLSAGSYTTNSADAHAYVASDSNSRVVAVDTVASLRKFLSKKDSMPNVVHIVLWGEEIPADVKEKHGDFVCSYDEFIAKGETVAAESVEARGKECDIKNCCTLIYTSGTTGNPKAVMCSHDAVIYSSAVVTDAVKETRYNWDMISFLPMSHVAAQVIDVFIPLTRVGVWNCPTTVSFARPDALKGSLPITMKSVKPTVFLGVPRVWEKFVEGVKAKAQATPATGLKKKLIDWSKSVGLRSSYNRQVGGDGSLPRGVGLANKLVFSKVRAALGLENCELCLTSAAPIQKETLEFLGSLGIDVCEAYGMSESCGMGTFCAGYRFKFGSVGFIAPGMELKTEHMAGRDKEGEGEICFRGRHVMMGYLNNEVKSRESIDDDGWLHSGDVGKIEPGEGMVSITGRIKELIIGAGGENIAPVPIEDTIKKNLPAVSNAIMIGDKRKFNSVLISLKQKPDSSTGAFLDELDGEAVKVSDASKTVTQAIKDPEWQKYIEAGIAAYNKVAVSNAQKIQKFTILPTDISVPGGELTATLKIKRNVVAEKYSKEIESMYA